MILINIFHSLEKLMNVEGSLTTAEEEIKRSRTTFGEQITEFKLREEDLEKTILSLESRNEGSY